MLYAKQNLNKYSHHELNLSFTAVYDKNLIEGISKIG